MLLAFQLFVLGQDQNDPGIPKTSRMHTKKRNEIDVTQSVLYPCPFPNLLFPLVDNFISDYKLMTV